MKHLISVYLLALCFAGYSQPTSFSPKGIGGGGALFFPKINPANDNEFYVSCDMSELFHSIDFGNSYSQIHHSKLQVFNTSTYEFTNNPNIAYSNFNDGNEGYPVKTTDGGNTWNNITGYNLGNYGTVYKMVANYANPNQLLIGAYGDILFSNDGATSFTLVKHASNMGAGLIMGGVFWDGNNIYIGTNNAERMYASVIHYGGTQGAQLGGIYMTNNLSAGAASSWVKLSNPTRTEGHPAAIVVLHDGNMVCTFSGRRNSSGAFTNSSGVFLYNPVTDTWSDKSDPGMHYWTKDIILDPTDATQNTWYTAVFSGWGGAPNGLGGLYKTIDRGNNWVKLTGSLFDRVTSMTHNPQNTNQAYLTTETQGLWISNNINTATPAWELINSYPFRQPERVFFNPFNQNEMWVTSFGNGLKTGYLYPSDVDKITKENRMIRIYPNPANNKIAIESNEISVLGTLSITNIQGQKILTQKIEGNKTEVQISNLTSGVYFVKIYNDKGISIGKFVKE